MPIQDNSGKRVMWDPSNTLYVGPANNVAIRREPSLDDLVAYSSLRSVPTKNIDYFEKKDEDFRQARFNVDEKHLIPYIPSKSVVLTNAGKVASGAKISTNVLDSLAKYGALTGISPVDALGVPTRETTLGLYPGNFLWKPNPFLSKEYTFHGQNKLVEEGVVSPAEILNNDQFYTSPYNDAIAWAGRVIGGVGSAGDARVRYHRNPATDAEMDAALAKSRAYSDRLASKIDMAEHPLLHGFRLFRNKKFNTGEPGYEEHVRTDGEATFNSPEVQAWWNSEGKNWYKGTRFEKNPLLKTVFTDSANKKAFGGDNNMPEKNDYRQRLIEWSVAHPGQLWADTPESAAARKWMQINAPEDFRSLYWNEDEKIRSGIDSRFLPKGVEQEVYNEGIREATNAAAPYVAGALVGSAGLAAGLGPIPAIPTMGSGLMKAGNALARGIDFVGKAAMPSAVLSGSAVAPYADAAALSYWSGKGLQAANQMRKSGRWGSAAALGAVSSMPFMMPLGMRGMRAYNLARNARVTPQEVLAEPFAERVISQPTVQSKMVEVPAPYEISDLGGGYMLKSLMRGSPLEKQLSKSGTVNVGNIKALANKGSKVEQAVIGKVLDTEFAGQKSIGYNKFRKAVQDELITYDRTPDTRWQDYGTGNLGFLRDVDTYRARQRMIDRFVGDHDDVEVFYGAGRNSDGTNVIFGDGEPEDLTMAEIIERFRQHDPAWFSGRTIPGESASTIKTNTYTFSSSRIPNGSSKHYDKNTLGHSRTYTTVDEPDVLHVMESQSDWAQGYNPKKLTEKRIDQLNRRVDRLKRDIADEEARLVRRERIDGSKIEYEWEQDQLKEIIARDKETLKDAVAELDSQHRPVSENVIERYLVDNYTSKQIQENLRYAAEKGQTKMRYPTRETAAKIEGYPEREAYFDAQGNDVTTKGNPEMWSYGEQQDKELRHLRKAIKDLEEEYTTWVQNDTYVRNGLDRKGTARAISNDLLEAQISRNSIISENEPKLAKGYSKKVVYDYEDILRKYTEFPKQFKKLYKNADVRTITDAKGNTWYEVDVPENYLKQEWAYGDGGHLNRLALGGIIERYGKDKIKSALAKMKQSK